MNTRTAAAVTAALLLASGLAACSKDSSSDTSGQVGGTLKYWATNMAPTLADDEKVLKPELEKFKAQTGVTVDVEVIPWDSLYNRILTAVSSGQGPDVLNIGNTWSASLQATGAFVKFDDANLAKVGGKEKFVATSLGATGAKGETPTSVPLYGQSYGLYYNTKMFKDAGIAAPPKTWDEFVADAKKLTKDTNGDGKTDQWGYTALGADIATNSHFAFFLGRQQGGSLFSDDGKPQFNSAEEVTAVKRLIDLMDVEKVVAPGNAEFVNTDSANNFAQGKSAMLIAQSGSRSFMSSVKFSDYAIGEVPVLAPLPPNGKPIQTMVAGINISVFDNSKNKASAMELVKFLTSKDAQVTINKANGTLPVIAEGYTDAGAADPALQTFGTILKNNAEPMPQIPAEGQMETLLGGALKNLWAKAAIGPVTDADVKAELDKANSQMAAAK
jgi:multiple sugar transport system substrate-binding protein